jgi:hypothetical protein
MSSEGTEELPYEQDYCPHPTPEDQQAKSSELSNRSIFSRPFLSVLKIDRRFHQCSSINHWQSPIDDEGTSPMAKTRVYQ